MDEAAYKKMLECVFTSDINVCDDVPSGAGRRGGAKLTNPLGGIAHQVDGADRYEYKLEFGSCFGGFGILSHAVSAHHELAC